MTALPFRVVVIGQWFHACRGEFAQFGILLKRGLVQPVDCDAHGARSVAVPSAENYQLANVFRRKSKIDRYEILRSVFCHAAMIAEILYISQYEFWPSY